MQSSRESCTSAACTTTPNLSTSGALAFASALPLRLPARLACGSVDVMSGCIRQHGRMTAVVLQPHQLNVSLAEEPPISGVVVAAVNEAHDPLFSSHFARMVIRPDVA